MPMHQTRHAGLRKLSVLSLVSITYIHSVVNGCLVAESYSSCSQGAVLPSSPPSIIIMSCINQGIVQYMPMHHSLNFINTCPHQHNITRNRNRSTSIRLVMLPVVCVLVKQPLITIVSHAKSLFVKECRECHSCRRCRSALDFVAVARSLFLPCLDLLVVTYHLPELSDSVRRDLIPEETPGIHLSFARPLVLLLLGGQRFGEVASWSWWCLVMARSWPTVVRWVVHVGHRGILCRGQRERLVDLLLPRWRSEAVVHMLQSAGGPRSGIRYS